MSKKEIIKEIQTLRDLYVGQYFSNYKNATTAGDQYEAQYQLGCACGALKTAMEILEVLYERMD